MAGFGTGRNVRRADAGGPLGKRMEIACKCWFTSTGEAIPLMIKVKDEEGEIRCITRIEVLYAEKKFYAGIPTRQYRCNLFYQGRRREAFIVFQPIENKWTMYINE